MKSRTRHMNEAQHQTPQNTGPGAAVALTYTVEEVAKTLRISRGSAYFAVASGEIPSNRVGRRILIPGDFFEGMLSAERNQSQGPNAA